MIIGITGPAGSGKSSAASMLCIYHGFSRLSFAAPMKSMMATLFMYAGVEWATDGLYSQEGKAKQLDPPFNCTTRHMLQTLGTEWGRKCIGDNIWTDLGIVRANNTPGNVVFDDVRFNNEAQAIRNAGGVIWHIHRPDLQPIAGDHESERGVDLGETERFQLPDFVITNHCDGLSGLGESVIQALIVMRGYGCDV